MAISAATRNKDSAALIKLLMSTLPGWKKEMWLKDNLGSAGGNVGDSRHTCQGFILRLPEVNLSCEGRGSKEGRDKYEAAGSGRSSRVPAAFNRYR